MDHDVFISYSSQDMEAAQAICHVLEQNEIRCWMAPRNIPPGSDYGDVIDDAIKSCKVVVIVYSEKAASSPWVTGELNVAFEEQKTIIPFRLDKTPLKGQTRVMLNQRHWIDAYPDYKTKFNDLVKAVALSVGIDAQLDTPPVKPSVQLKKYKKPLILKVLTAPIAIIAAPISIAASGINSIVNAIKEQKRQAKQHGLSYGPAYNTYDEDLTYSSIYAPAEAKPKSHMQIQVYLHLYEETEKVKTMAQESDKNAERRDYIPLQCKLNKGDKVNVLMNIYGEKLLMSDNNSVVWQGSFTKCSFDYFIPKDIDVDELSCVALLSVNGIPVGEMRFITKIVESPRKLNPQIIAHKYNKVFISYAHKDEAKVKSFHEGLKLAGIEHFFDRAYLRTGDIFPQVIQDYINSADLFVLFWSENASRSEYVDKERKQALERAFPQVKPQQEAKLSIYPMSIEPRAELPSDMKENYHFGEV